MQLPDSVRPKGTSVTHQIPYPYGVQVSSILWMENARRAELRSGNYITGLLDITGWHYVQQTSRLSQVLTTITCRGEFLCHCVPIMLAAFGLTMFQTLPHMIRLFRSCS